MTTRSIDARNGGLGDLMVALWIAAGAESVGETIPVVCDRPGFRDVATAFGTTLALTPTPDCLVLGADSPAYLEELATPDDTRPRTVRWQETVGWDYAPIRPTLGDLPAEDEAWAQGWTESFGAGKIVALAVKSDYPLRTWPKAKMLRVARELEASGLRTVALDRLDLNVSDFPGRYLYGASLLRVLALLRRCDALVGCDSGLAHVAGTMGLPTVAILGPTDPGIVFGHLPEVVPVRVDPQTVPCVGCHFSAAGGYGADCDRLGCDALASLSWRVVYDRAMEVL